MTMKMHATDASILEIRGEDRVDLLHRLSTNDLRGLSQSGHRIDTVFTTNQGRMVDWCWITSRGDHLLVHTSPQRTERLAAWIDTYTIMEDVAVRDVSAAWSSITVQGAGVAAALGGAVDAGAVHERDGVLWSPDLACYGEGFVGLVPRDTVGAATARLEAAGVVSVDARAFELARVRAGVPSPAFEFADEANPLELRLMATISWTKGCYIGQEVISRLDNYDKLARWLMGFEAQLSGGVPEKLVVDGKSIGRVTSWVRDGSNVVGLAVVSKKSTTDDDVVLLAGDSQVPATLHDRRFWAG